MLSTSLIAIAVQLATATPLESDIILGLRFETILQRLGLTPSRPIELTSLGVSADFYGQESQIVSLSVGVFPSLDAAESAIERRNCMTPVGPRVADTDAPLGDYVAWWTFSSSGPEESNHVVFRRKNCVVCVSIREPDSQSFQVLQQLDHWLQHDPTIALWGCQFVTPEITEIWVPSPLLLIEPYETDRYGFRVKWPQPRLERLRFKFRGVSNPDALRIRIVEQPFDSNIRNEVSQNGTSLDFIEHNEHGRTLRRPRTPEEDGRYMLRVPEEAGRHQLFVVAITPDNLVLWRELPIFVVDNTDSAAIKWSEAPVASSAPSTGPD